MTTAPTRPNPSLLLRLFRLRESGVFFALVLLFAILSVTRYYSFLSPLNLQSLATQITFTAISGIGVLFVILSGGIDLSVGASAGLSGFVCAIVVVLTPNPYVGIAAGFAAAILTGALLGGLSGSIISYLKVTPFIVTLGMMWIARSLIYVLGRVVVAGHLVPQELRQDSAMPVTGIPEIFVQAGSGSFAGIPVPVLVLLCVAAAAHFTLAHTTFGRRLYAVGGNEQAALYSGISVPRTKLLAYITCSAISGITGFLFVARFTSGTMEAGRNHELEAIAAAVIGGTSLVGGAGSVLGVILGACVMGVVSNGMDMFGIPPEPKPGIIGAVIIAAAIIDALRNRSRS